MKYEALKNFGKYATDDKKLIITICKENNELCARIDTGRITAIEKLQNIRLNVIEDIYNIDLLLRNQMFIGVSEQEIIDIASYLNKDIVCFDDDLEIYVRSNLNDKRKKMEYAAHYTCNEINDLEVYLEDANRGALSVYQPS